ncbi:MAG: hypothetical protein ABIA63_02120 [bacterium]
MLLIIIITVSCLLYLGILIFIFKDIIFDLPSKLNSQIQGEIMNIEYEETGKQPHLAFYMVENNQFFYDKDGALCQKIDDDYCHQIADLKGILCTSDSIICYGDQKIKAICKKIKKISIEIELGEI